MWIVEGNGNTSFCNCRALYSIIFVHTDHNRYQYPPLIHTVVSLFIHIPPIDTPFLLDRQFSIPKDPGRQNIEDLVTGTIIISFLALLTMAIIEP